MLLTGGGERRRDQLGHGGVAVGFGKDVGDKAGALRGRHNNHLRKQSRDMLTLVSLAREGECCWRRRGEQSKAEQVGGETDLLSGGVGGGRGGLGEGDLDWGDVRGQGVGDALHDVAHLGAATHGHGDGLGDGGHDLGHLLQHHRGGARGVGAPALTRFLVFVCTAHTCATQKRTGRRSNQQSGLTMWSMEYKCSYSRTQSRLAEGFTHS